MKKEIITQRKALKTGFPTKTYEGENIESKCERITENNEPISDGAELNYTQRKDGVLPEYNIRTDKWDVAQDAMEKVASAKKNKIQEKLKGATKPEEKEQEEQKN